MDQYRRNTWTGMGVIHELEWEKYLDQNGWNICAIFGEIYGPENEEYV